MTKKRLKSFRLNAQLLDKAKEQSLDLPKLIEATIAKQLKLKVCPYCGKS